MPTVDEIAKWVRPDEMHQAFNFAYAMTRWNAGDLREVIIDSLRAFPDVGAPATWVLSNHDVIRHTTRLALPADVPQGHGIGPKTPDLPRHGGRPAPRTRRDDADARAARIRVPLTRAKSSACRRRSTFRMTRGRIRPGSGHNGERYGRDGCRVPIPWEAGVPGVWVQPGPGETWLPPAG